jgi:GNAT superfamily N-acetyltransferase
LARDDDAGFITGLASRFAECDLPEWRTREEIANGTAEQLERALERGNGERSTIFIAEVNGEPAGFAWVLLLEDFYTGAPIGKVSEIAVARSGNGTGQVLMEHCERWARERGAELITLNALEGNAYARKFYERGGYAPEYTMYVKRL